MGDTESCSSRAVDFGVSQSGNQRQKVKVYNEVLRRLHESEEQEARLPGFEDELWALFHRLPIRYAVDVNVERAQDVLMHKRLLQRAQNPATRPAIEVRLVQVHSKSDGNCSDLGLQCLSKQSIHPPPAFGTVPDLEPSSEGEGNVVATPLNSRLMHEITFSTKDKPKLLSELTLLLSEIGLNIQEAHAFSTIDGYSLDVFVVDNWPSEETEQLKYVLGREIPKIEKTDRLRSEVYHVAGKEHTGKSIVSTNVNIPSDHIDVWEIDMSLLKYEYKIASGSYGDLYKGTFCSQDVAIKVLMTKHLNDKLQREFAQEVFIMRLLEKAFLSCESIFSIFTEVSTTIPGNLRKIQHKNVVQFIGACTRPPSLCIVTEYMSGGSMYDFLHRQKGVLSLPSLLRVAIDVSKGMNYLHQNNIVHRDLKAANLLMDENGAVKVADFGVARMKNQSGVMTAETGTYRWMAPEVIEHKPYDHKADVFSFGIVLWELLTGKLPYEHLTPLQAAVGVVQQGLRPSIPRHTHPQLEGLLLRCWQQDAFLRPEFSEILGDLQQLAKAVARKGNDREGADIQDLQ